MSAASDGNVSTTENQLIEDKASAIEVVIEKLQEIVGDIQQKKQTVKVSTTKENVDPSSVSGSEPDGSIHEEEKHSVASYAAKGKGAVVLITPNDLPGNTESVKDSTRINIVPISSSENESSSKPGIVVSGEQNEKGTSVIITTQKGDTPSQVVLNFPVDAGEFNVKNPQGLVDTLLKLNSVLSKGKDSGQKSLLTYQKGGKMTTEVQLYKCAKCDYWSHNKYYLKQHVDLVHNAERVYKCPFCDYAGKRSHSLKEHLVVHSNYRPYVCSQCNASFRKKGHLTNHIKMHSSYKEPGNLVCPICVNNNFENLLALHIHLRERHPKKVYACDICQYATFLNKGNITMHMLTHGSPKVYACSSCNFTALHDKIMEEHISETHVNSFSGNKPVQAVKITSEGNAQKQFPKIWLKCSECGFSTDERGVLHDHMLSKHLQALQKKSLEESSEANLSMFNSKQEDGNESDIVSSDVLKKAAEIKTEREPHKCTKCEYQCSEASTFIQHMLIHKQPYDNSSKELNTVSPAFTSKVTSPDTNNKSLCSSNSDGDTLVKRPHEIHSGKNTSEPQIPSQPYTYDESTKWYQCTICGYSSEQQRTIKAHIWKHSGHKDLDYPMFQNGPISVYDETPIGVPVLLRSLSEEESTGGINSTKLTDKSNSPMLKEENQDSLSKKEDNKSRKNVIYVKVPDNKVINQKEFGSQIPDILKQLDASEGEYHIVQTQKDVIINEITVRLEKKSNALINRPKILLQPIESIPKITHLPKVQFLPSGYQLKKNELNTHVENIAKQVLNTNSDEYQNPEEVILDDNCLDIQEEVVESEKGHALRYGKEEVSKKRKVEDTSFDHSVKKMCIQKEKLSYPDEGVVVQDVSQVYTTPEVAINHDNNTIRLDMNSIQLPTPEMAAEVSVVSSHSPPKRMLSIDNTSSSSSSDDDNDSQMSGSFDKNDAEVITLLSLLKKGPNFNPACPVLNHKNMEIDSQNDDEDSTGSSFSGSNQQKQGISSSLLAVIEQLRERTTSTSEEKGSKDSSKSLIKSSKKKKKDKDEVLKSTLNIEAISGSFRCLSCFYTHPSLEALKIHMKLHQNRDPFECSLCDYKGKSSEELQDHMLQHCKLRTYQCKMCDAAFNYKSQLRAHMSAHPMTCSKCEYETSNPTEFRAHVKLHESKKKLYVCKKCDMTFQDKEEAETHPAHCAGVGEKQNKKTGKREYKCEFCPAIAHTQAVLKAHMRTHDVSQNLQCDLCGFMAYSVRSLKSHMKRHINDQRFVQQPLEQYKCNLCGYVCHHLPSLKSHMWRHSSDKNYNYEEINNIINRALECEDPENENTSQDPQSTDSEGHLNYLIMFRCCQCGFESVHKSSLNAHMKTHMDIIKKTLEVNQERLVHSKSSRFMTDNERIKPSVKSSEHIEELPSSIVQVHVKK